MLREELERRIQKLERSTRLKLYNYLKARQYKEAIQALSHATDNITFLLQHLIPAATMTTLQEEQRIQGVEKDKGVQETLGAFHPRRQRKKMSNHHCIL